MADKHPIPLVPKSSKAVTAARRLNTSKLHDARVAMRLTQTELARRVGVARQSISMYEQGLTVPEPPVMERISSAVNQPLSYFSGDPAPEFGNASIHFHRAIGSDTKRRNMACEVFGSWLARTARYLDEFVNYPSLDLPLALEPVSESSRYSDEEIESAASQCREMWRLGSGPISNMVSLLENKGVLVCRRVIPDEKVEAFSFWNGNKALVFLSSEKTSCSRARFDAAHELGHLILHRWAGLEDLEDKKTLKRIEHEADLFAGAFLLPLNSFLDELFSTRIDAFLPMKRRWKVSIQAMVYRCKHLGVIDEEQATNLFKTISFRKWRRAEPYDDTIPPEEPQLLNRAANLLLSSGLKTPDDMARAIQINRHTIEQICNLPGGALNSTSVVKEFRPTLK